MCWMIRFIASVFDPTVTTGLEVTDWFKTGMGSLIQFNVDGKACWDHNYCNDVPCLIKLALPGPSGPGRDREASEGKTRTEAVENKMFQWAVVSIPV